MGSVKRTHPAARRNEQNRRGNRRTMQRLDAEYLIMLIRLREAMLQASQKRIDALLYGEGTSTPVGLFAGGD